MAYYFKHHPTTNYDMYLDGRPQHITNVMVSFRIQEILKDKTSLFYKYSIKESDRPDIIARKYYEDDTLDWVIYTTNKIVNPLWEWPLNYVSFNNYIVNKYDSLSSAKTTVHHYEKILAAQTILSNGTIVPERFITIDQTTFLATPASDTRTIYNYDYEEDLNDAKREIKILDKRYIGFVTSAVESIFK